MSEYVVSSNDPNVAWRADYAIIRHLLWLIVLWPRGGATGETEGE